MTMYKLLNNEKVKLTAEEEADRLAAKAAWAEVSAIRAASNTIESQELPTDYLGLIDAFDTILV